MNFVNEFEKNKGAAGGYGLGVGSTKHGASC